MLESQKQQLKKHPSEYISIGITDDGEPINSHPVPWSSSTNAYNMRIPDVYITPDDLKDEVLMSFFETMKVIGLYIFSDLEDYSFISRFKEIFDLNIMCGHSIRNLDFLEGIKSCRMLLLTHAQLENLDVIAKEKLESESFRTFACLGLFRCKVEKVDSLLNPDIKFSEFITWSDNDEDTERWNGINANTKKHFKR